MLWSYVGRKNQIKSNICVIGMIIGLALVRSVLVIPLHEFLDTLSHS
jgi:hypothetical protein